TAYDTSMSLGKAAREPAWNGPSKRAAGVSGGGRIVVLSGQEEIGSLALASCLAKHGFGQELPPKQRYLISEDSSIPHLSPSRPRPDSCTPPNGATSVEMMPVLMPTMPYSRASATRQTRDRSFP